MSMPPLASLYISMSLVSFVLYGIDKSAARHDYWRIPERLLHLIALLGGWPGALAAQALIRHKSRKRRFQCVFWLTAAVNMIALGWWMAD